MALGTVAATAHHGEPGNACNTPAQANNPHCQQPGPPADEDGDDGDIDVDVDVEVDPDVDVDADVEVEYGLELPYIALPIPGPDYYIPPVSDYIGFAPGNGALVDTGDIGSGNEVSVIDCSNESNGANQPGAGDDGPRCPNIEVGDIAPNILSDPDTLAYVIIGLVL